MTPVEFQFNYPDGRPIAGMEFVVKLPKSGFIKEADGIIMPADLTFETDAQGFALVLLAPSSSVYTVRMTTPGQSEDYDSCRKGVSYKFYVPDTTETVRAQDLFLAPPPNSEPWDETAIRELTEAKIVAVNAAETATDAATRAEAAAEGVGEFAERAEAARNEAVTAATEARDSADSAALSATAASDAATDSAASEASAEQSAAEALVSKNSATTSATTASTKASEAAASALAAMNSQTAAKTSETNAKASEVAALPAIAAGLRFCGSAATAPTARTNGTALQRADEYQNTVDNLRYSWTGAAWVALNSSAQQLEVALSAPTGAGKVMTTLPNGFAGSVFDYMVMLEKRSAKSIYDYAHLVVSKPTPANPATWDWTPAFQAAADTGKPLTVPDHLMLCGPVSYAAGWRVYGQGGGRFMLENAKSVIRSLNPGEKLFYSKASTFKGQREGGGMFDVRLESDFPFQCGDYSVAVTEGGASPYEMRSFVMRCSFAPITTLSGDGVVFVKCFDHIMEGCDITGFSRNIIEIGSDKGAIRNNRIINFNLFGLLQLSTSTFGSETTVDDNEFLGGGVDSIYYKTTSRHVRGNNNYFERSGEVTVKGFFDASGTDAPTLGPNPVATVRLLSVSFTRMRNDSKAKARDFVNRLEPVGFSAEITDVGTSGPAATLSWLTIEGGDLPLFGNTTNSCMYTFKGGSQNVDTWRTFDQSSVAYSAGSVSFNNRSLLDLDNSELKRNNAYQNVRLAENGFVLKPALKTTLFHCIFRGAGAVLNPNFKEGVVYDVKVVARARVGTATLAVVKIVTTGSTPVQQGATVTATLTTQNTVINTTITGTAPTNKIGLAFHVFASENDIIIEHAEFTEVDTSKEIVRGSNAKGEFTKFPDGTLITWGKQLVTATVPAGQGVTWNPGTANQPSPFVGTPNAEVRFAMMSGAAGAGNSLYTLHQCHYQANDMATVGVNMGTQPALSHPLMTYGTTAAESYYVFFKCTGRWK